MSSPNVSFLKKLEELIDRVTSIYVFKRNLPYGSVHIFPQMMWTVRDKDKGHSFEDTNVHILDREDRWFEKGVKEAVCLCILTEGVAIIFSCTLTPTHTLLQLILVSHMTLICVMKHMINSGLTTPLRENSH